MSDWKKDKDLGPWPFTPQPNKWGYLNNPRWQLTARAFVKGGPDDYDGRESLEPQIFSGPDRSIPQSVDDQKIHHQCGHWHKGTIPGGINVFVPIEMFFTNYYESSAPYVWEASKTTIDPADYDNKIVNAYFEVTVNWAPGEAGHHYRLTDVTGNTIYADIEIPEDADAGIRIRSDSFELVEGSTDYYVQNYYIGDGWCSCACREARILLEVVNTTKARIQIPLISGDQSGPGCTDMEDPDSVWGFPNFLYSYCARTSKNSWGYDDGGGSDPGNFPYNFVLFKKEDSKWDEIDHWDFEVMGALHTLSAGSAALFNKTTGLMVAGSQIDFAENDGDIPLEVYTYYDPDFFGSWPIKKSIQLANDAENFTSEDEFELRIKAVEASDFSTVFIVMSACLYPVIKNATKCQVYYRCGSDITGSYGVYGVYDTDVRIKYEMLKFHTGTKVQFETTAYTPLGGLNSKLYLLDMGAVDDGAAEFWRHGTAVSSVDAGGGNWDNVSAESLSFVEGGPISATSAYIICNASGTPKVTATGIDTSIPGGAISWFARAYVAFVPGFLTVAGGPQVNTSFKINGHSVYLPVQTPMGSYPPIGNLLFLQQSIVHSISPSSSIEVAITSNATLTDPLLYAINEIALIIGLASDVLLSELVITATRSRLRIGDIAGLMIENDRYITHWVVPDAPSAVAHAMSFLIFEVSNE